MGWTAPADHGGYKKGSRKEPAMSGNEFLDPDSVYGEPSYHAVIWREDDPIAVTATIVAAGVQRLEELSGIVATRVGMDRDLAFIADVFASRVLHGSMRKGFGCRILAELRVLSAVGRTDRRMLASDGGSAEVVHAVSD